MMDFLNRVISFQDIGMLLPLVTLSILAGVVLGVISGLIGPMIHARDMSFGVHGCAELSFAGAAIALYFEQPVVVGGILGSVVAAAILAFLGAKAQQRNSAIAVMLPFGLGVGVLFLSLYQGRSSNSFGLLTGQIVAVDDAQLASLVILAAVVALVLVPTWRPLWFASVDASVARARGVPVRSLNLVFMLCLGLVVAMCVQLIGSLLVMSLLITPTAAAVRVVVRPLYVTLLSMLFAVAAMTIGIVLSLSPGLPISPYVTTVSFAIYLVCLVIGAARDRLGWGRRQTAVARA